MAEGCGRRDDDGGSPARDPGRVAARCTAVIPAWRAEKTLARTLRSLVTENRDAVERVIVVGCAGDESARVAAGFPGVETLALGERASAGRARNLGRRLAADAELLLFVDADCAPVPGAVAKLIDALHARELDAAGAAIACAGAGVVPWLRHLLEFKEAEPGVEQPAPAYLPSTALLVRAGAFDAAGGFPDMWPGEDLVFGYRLRACGRRMAKIADAVAVHLHPRGVRTMLDHQRRLGATSARARTMVAEMPGAVFAGRPWLAPVLFLGRALRALAWIAAHRPRDLGRFAASLPLYLLALASWTSGFFSVRAGEGIR